MRKLMMLEFRGKCCLWSVSINLIVPGVTQVVNLIPGFKHGKMSTAVLVWAGIEFIFFIVASMGLCFGFVLETVLIVQGCFSYC